MAATPFTLADLEADLFDGRNPYDEQIASLVDSAKSFLTMSGGGLDYWLTLIANRDRTYASNVILKEYFIAKDIAAGTISFSQGNSLLRKYAAETEIDRVTTRLKNDKSYYEFILQNPDKISPGLDAEYMKDSIARDEQILISQQSVRASALSELSGINLATLTFTTALDRSNYPDLATPVVEDPLSNNVSGTTSSSIATTLVSAAAISALSKVNNIVNNSTASTSQALSSLVAGKTSKQIIKENPKSTGKTDSRASSSTASQASSSSQNSTSSTSETAATTNAEEATVAETSTEDTSVSIAAVTTSLSAPGKGYNVYSTRTDTFEKVTAPEEELEE